MKDTVFIFTLVFIAGMVIAADMVTRDIAKETAITAAMNDYSAGKVDLQEQAKKALIEHIVPLLKQAEALQAQSEKIKADMDSYMQQAQVPAEQAAMIDGYVDAKIDPNTIEENARLLDLLKVITVIVIEDITHEKFTDPNLVLPAVE